MRVYELAKQVNLSNKDLLAKLHSLGIEAKSHASSVDDGAVRQLYELLDQEKPANKPKAPPTQAKEKPSKKGTPATSARKPPKPVKKASEKEEKPKLDARAIALQRIAAAKAKRQQAHQEALRAKEVSAQNQTLQAPEHQEIDLAASSPQIKKAPTPPPAPKPEPPAPKKAPAQAAKPEKPPKPQPAPEKPQQRVVRRQVELEQMPGLPKRTPPRNRRDDRGDQPADLTVPPSIDVMPLKPARKHNKKPDARDDKPRKKGLRPAKDTGGKKIRPGRFLNLDTIEETVKADSRRKPIRPRSDVLAGSNKAKPHQEKPETKEIVPKKIRLVGDITVGEFAEKLNLTASDVIAKAMELGEMLSINRLISLDLCELLATEFEVDVEVVPETDETDVEHLLKEEGEEEADKLEPRPPVVTVMGHVDHGKTSLLDAIRKTSVAEGEFGGITQHIGAYHVDTSRGEIVFLDTPGHEAFTAMRARGASVTDIVILIVAADDSLMPQTVEAINHARAANVPIIVAINKIDLPGANIQKTRNDLMQHNLISEDLGGDTIICEISAKQETGIDNLLEMVALQAEVMELKANPYTRVQGVVVESEVDPQRGISATILIKKGTLNQGDAFVCGDVSGRVRFMRNDRGQNIDKAGPSQPVEILGLDGCPQVGEPFIGLESERQARQIAEVREDRRRRHSQNASTRPHMTLEGLSDYLGQDDQAKTLQLIVKADVQGSVEAVTQSLERLSNEKVNINVLHSGVGVVTESDVQLAMASDAVIIGFNVRSDAVAAELAHAEGVDVKHYRIIYKLLEDIQAAMLGMLDKKYKEAPRGSAEIRQIFKVSRLGNIAGCHVQSGNISRNDKVRLVRDGAVVYEGELASLRRGKDDTSSVQSGYECGITLKDFQDIKEGDIIETYVMEEVAQTM